MALRPAPPQWQTATCLFVGLTVFVFEVGLNAVTGQPVDYSILGSAVALALGGPVLKKSSNRKGRDDNDDADDQ